MNVAKSMVGIRSNTILTGGRQMTSHGKYTDEELFKLMEDEGEDISRYRTGMTTEADDLTERGAKVRPTQIMAEVRAQGLNIPWSKVGAFLICVFKELMSNSLPIAVATCATKFIPGNASGRSTS
jgi:hypothetical protein